MSFEESVKSPNGSLVIGETENASSVVQVVEESHAHLRMLEEDAASVRPRDLLVPLRMLSGPLGHAEPSCPEPWRRILVRTSRRA